MRTSLDELVEIEKYLFKKFSCADKLLFEAKLLLDEDLRKNVLLQEKIYLLLSLFYRKELKKQAGEVFDAMMNNPKKPEFRNKITGIFNQE